ncbi:MAG TPA: hypothetical protein VF062_23400 [Candidatus Limnocylindrales bacterium]
MTANPLAGVVPYPQTRQAQHPDVLQWLIERSNGVELHDAIAVLLSELERRSSPIETESGDLRELLTEWASIRRGEDGEWATTWDSEVAVQLAVEAEFGTSRDDDTTLPPFRPGDRVFYEDGSYGTVVAIPTDEPSIVVSLETPEGPRQAEVSPDEIRRIDDIPITHQLRPAGGVR